MDLLFFILGQILPFYPPNNPKNQNFKKVKKAPGDTIILHKCTKNHDHMLFCSWDMVCDKCHCYFSFWAIFCPYTTQKIEISSYIITYVYQKLWSDDVWFLRYSVQQTVGWTDGWMDGKVTWGKMKKWKWKVKNEKICWRYYHFTHVYQKSQSYDVWFLRYRVRQT